MQSFLVRLLGISLNASTIQALGQPLTLECNMTAVRGITSRVDVMWSRNGLQLEAAKRVTVSYPHDNTALYTFLYTIPQLSITDDGRVYQCEVVINTSPPISSTDSITLDVTGINF